MSPQQRQMLQIARKLRTHLHSLGSNSSRIPWCPDREWHRCQGLFRRLEICQERGWPVAARFVRDELGHAVAFLSVRLAGLKEDLEERISPGPVPALGALYQEISALFEEFEDVKYTPKCQSLTVTTEPIELEEVFLGRFEIRLNLRDLGRDEAYEVVALQPHPAGTNESVTHPHVQDDHLCEGEGRLPIARALAQGRLTDFFRIIVQILSTYNAGSAYVALERWSGTHCGDCGATVSHDEAYACESCDRDICSDCRSVCEPCGVSCCSGCQSECRCCDVHVCRRCQKTCAACAEPFCAGCLTQERCQECHAEPPCDTHATAPENPDLRTTLPAQALLRFATAADGDPAAAIQPDRLGQVAVLP